MNRVYEWTQFYNPKKGLYQYQHKGSGLITDNLLKISKNIITGATQPTPMSTHRIP